MKKVFVFILCFFLLSVSAIAQTHIIIGTITDNLAQALPYTNVLARPHSEELEMAFAITDEQGRFKLTLKSDEKYTISVSYLGFESISFEIALQKDLEKNIILQTKDNQLDEVIIIQSIPVLVKEDTIIYDTQAFVTGEERKLKQVLKKLPGVEVDKEGGVTVNGEKVTKLLVDGKTFFGGGTKLGVENIPADAVDKVEILDNYNEVSFLKGLTDSDKMAMNIQLKKDKKKFYFGDIEAGTGTDSHYIVHPNLYYYSPKTNVNFIGDLNDIGVKSFTVKDYMNYEGGIGKMMKDPSAYFKLSSNDFAQFLENQDFEAGKNQFAAININQKINTKFDVSAYAIFSNTQTETRNETRNEYITETPILVENRIAEGNLNNTFFLAKMALDYIPNSEEDISYTGFVKIADNEQNDKLITDNNVFTNFLNNQFLSNAFTLKQNAEWHKKLAKKHTMSTSVNYEYQKTDPFSNWLTSEPILQEILPIISDSIINLQQHKNLKIHNLNLMSKYYWVLNNSNHIYTTLGNNFLKENFYTNDFQELSTGQINDFGNAGYNNDLDFLLNDFFIGVQHKFKTGITTVKYGATAHYYHWKANQDAEINKSKLLLLPDFLMKIDFNNSVHLNFNYNLKSSFTDAPKFANRLQLLNYKTVTRGNENLENELYHTARLSYRKFSMYQGIFLNAIISFDKKIKGIRNEVVLEGINQFTSPILLDNPETNWNMRGEIRKSLGSFTLKGRGSARFSNYVQIINQQTTENNSSSQNFGLSLVSNFKKLPNFEIGYDKNFGKLETPSSISNYTSETPFIELDYDFLNGFIFSADYSRTIYRNYFGQKNNYELANVYLFYQKEDSAWGFKISGTNILGVNYKYENSFSDYIITDERTFILPRIWLFTISFKI